MYRSEQSISCLGINCGVHFSHQMVRAENCCLQTMVSQFAAKTSWSMSLDLCQTQRNIHKVPQIPFCKVHKDLKHFTFKDVERSRKGQQRHGECFFIPGSVSRVPSLCDRLYKGGICIHCHSLAQGHSRVSTSPHNRMVRRFCHFNGLPSSRTFSWPPSKPWWQISKKWDNFFCLQQL